jgi:EAL domain-containing protein (putative c-di-GMP-specific phosphodiesterase class I)
MGLRVVAECIEDRATLDLLLELGCDVGQGNFISRPAPPDRLVLPPARRSRSVAAAPA